MSDNNQKDTEQTILPSYDIEKSPFNWEQLDKLLALKPSLVTCADILGVHENTIKNHIKARFGLTYTEYAARKLSKTRVKLVQKAIESALAGNATLMIFCLKNLCEWQDKIENVNIDTTPIKIEIVKDNAN